MEFITKKNRNFFGFITNNTGVVQSDYAIVPALLHNLEMPMPYNI